MPVDSDQTGVCVCSMNAKFLLCAKTSKNALSNKVLFSGQKNNNIN